MGVPDLTYVATWAGTAYVCFIVDVFSRTIVGWRAATNMATTMVLDALEMARWARGARLEGLICHSDAGSQFTSIRYGERLAEIGALPSIGSVADSYDCEDPWVWARFLEGFLARAGRGGLTVAMTDFVSMR